MAWEGGWKKILVVSKVLMMFISDQQVLRLEEKVRNRGNLVDSAADSVYSFFLNNLLFLGR